MMHEGTICPHRLVCGQGCGGELGTAASCSGFSSTFCRRSSFPEGITNTGLALLQGIRALPGQQVVYVPRSRSGQLGRFIAPGHTALLPAAFFQPDV